MIVSHDEISLSWDILRYGVTSHTVFIWFLYIFPSSSVLRNISSILASRYPFFFQFSNISLVPHGFTHQQWASYARIIEYTLASIGISSLLRPDGYPNPFIVSLQERMIDLTRSYILLLIRPQRIWSIAWARSIFLIYLFPLWERVMSLHISIALERLEIYSSLDSCIVGGNCTEMSEPMNAL